MNRKISVIIPSHNGADTLPRCLDSILAQTYTDFEVIVVVNNSTDNSAEVLSKYVLQDERITFVTVHKGGVSRARNVGMKLATGAYIQYIDADDDIVPHMFEKLVQTIEATKADMVTFRFTHNCWKSFLPAGTYNLLDINSGFKLYSDFFTFELPWNKLIRRRVITKPFDESADIFEGSLFYLDNRRIKKVVVIDDELYNYNNEGGDVENASLINKFLQSKFWETKMGYWHRFYAMDARFRKAIKAIYLNIFNIERFMQVRLFDMAFVELVKIIASKVPQNIIAIEMHNIFNEPIFKKSVKFFGQTVMKTDMEICEKFVEQCCKYHELIKSGQVKGEPFYKYIDLFFNVICGSGVETLPSFDVILENVGNQ